MLVFGPGGVERSLGMCRFCFGREEKMKSSCEMVAYQFSDSCLVCVRPVEALCRTVVSVSAMTAWDLFFSMSTWGYSVLIGNHWKSSSPWLDSILDRILRDTFTALGCSLNRARICSAAALEYREAGRKHRQHKIKHTVGKLVLELGGRDSSTTGNIRAIVVH